MEAARDDGPFRGDEGARRRMGLPGGRGWTERRRCGAVREGKHIQLAISG
ncbi:hypothetical protein GCM10010378_56020 [Streptomyces viridochromogenes]